MYKKTVLLLLSLLFLGFSVNAQTVRMQVGDTETLSPSVLQQKVLAGQPAWTSSRPYDVRIVSTTMYTCTIEAVNSFSGYAVIHCLYYYRERDPVTGKYIYQRSGYVDYNVLVEETKPSSIDISPTNIELNFGDTHRMTVTILPSNANQKVTWTSSNSSVASVNSDNILGANGYGTAVVTATTSNGLSASCSVKVKKNSSENGGSNSGGSNNNSGSDNNGGSNSGNVGQDSANEELDYYVQIAKKRMKRLRRIAIQEHKN